MRKKHLAFFLAFILGCSLLAFPAAADGAVLRVTPPDSYPKVGESFEVTVELEGNLGFRGIVFTLCFDQTAMRCTRIKTGDLLDGDVISASNKDAPSGAALAVASFDVISQDGTVAIFIFEALQDITDWAFTLEEATLSDTEYEIIPIGFALAEAAPQPADTPAPAPTDGSAADETPEESGQTTPASESGGSTGLPGGVPAGSGSGNTGGTATGGSSGNTGGSTNTGSTDIGSASDESSKAEEPEEEPVAILFTDTEDHWGAEFIAKAVQRKLFQGYSDGRFGPDDPVTRAQYVTVLYRMAGSPEVTGQTPFTDISDQIPEFRNAILWAYQNGYVNGRTEDSFDPAGKLTRQEAMKILFGYSGGESGTELMFAQIYDSSFSDSVDIADWARPAMYWAFYHTLITGTSDSTLGPLDTATRAQLAKILVNYTEM